MEYRSIPTTLGRAKLEQAALMGVPLQLTVVEFGDGGGAEYAPTGLETALRGKVYEAGPNMIFKAEEAETWVELQAVIPFDVGGWWLREYGVRDAAGDLIFIGNLPQSFKPQGSSGAIKDVAFELLFDIQNADSVTLKVDPAKVLATRKYVDDGAAAHAAAIDPHGQYALRGKVTTLTANGNIDKAAHEGLVLLAASGGARTFTLPASSVALGVVEFVLRRVDTTTNALVIAASGTDKVMLDTTAAAAGQSSTELLFAGDFLRLRSDGAGKWWCVGQAQLPGSIASGLVSYAAAGAHTFTVPAVLRSGRRHARVTVTGAGGSGGMDSTVGAAGGGAGGTAIKRINLSGVVTVAVTVGAGGGGRAGSGNGFNGGSSSFGSYCSGTGGLGGYQNGTAGTGGDATGGDINILGGYGFNRVEAAAVNRSSGGGGASIFGNGTSGANNSSNGRGPGSGSGGAQTSSGAGADGIVIIEW